mmetsp:Transcript_11701/g.19228  ORF Transcript_11701/g.19228 Transcript_11701/m.19228 type:complete len:144 (-) Transcript_11701:1740-2171(-)
MWYRVPSQWTSSNKLAWIPTIALPLPSVRSLPQLPPVLLLLPVDEMSPIETAKCDRRWSKAKMVYYLRTAFRNDEDARVAGPLPAVNDGDFKKIRLNVSNNGGDNDVCLKDYLEQYWSYKNYTGEQIEQELAALTLEPYVNMK